MGYNHFTTENMEFTEKKAGDGLVEEIVFNAKDAKESEKRETQKMFAKFARFATFAFKKKPCGWPYKQSFHICHHLRFEHSQKAKKLRVLCALRGKTGGLAHNVNHSPIQISLAQSCEIRYNRPSAKFQTTEKFYGNHNRGAGKRAAT